MHGCIISIRKNARRDDLFGGFGIKNRLTPGLVNE